MEAAIHRGWARTKHEAVSCPASMKSRAYRKQAVEPRDVRSKPAAVDSIALPFPFLSSVACQPFTNLSYGKRAKSSFSFKKIIDIRFYRIRRA